MVAAALKCEELKEISQVGDICATFQASSADSERGFSLMNHIKIAFPKSSCSGTFGPPGAHKVKARSRRDIKLDKVYNHWRSEKDRREK